MKQTKNISSFFERVIEDDRLYPSHISMYVSLFQFWTMNRFQNPFRICREEVMNLSKIKSLATYHKCIRELHCAGFIIYSPSYNPYRGSSIEIIDFESEEKGKNKLFQNQKLFPKEEICFSVPMIDEVERYFAERGFLPDEADQFYSFYHSVNWKLCNKKPMKCWQSAARNWISKVKKYQSII